MREVCLCTGSWMRAPRRNRSSQHHVTIMPLFVLVDHFKKKKAFPHVSEVSEPSCIFFIHEEEQKHVLFDFCCSGQDVYFQFHVWRAGTCQQAGISYFKKYFSRGKFWVGCRVLYNNVFIPLKNTKGWGGGWGTSKVLRDSSWRRSPHGVHAPKSGAKRKKNRGEN